MRRSAFLLLAACGVLSACGSNVTVLPPDFELDGKTAGDLSAEWWQWAQSIPDARNPVRDTSGVNCHVGQQGDVWFLAGGYGSSRISRRCTVPAGQYIFFPAINMAYWARGESGRFTCADAKLNAVVNNDTALEIFVEIDGEPLENANFYRARTTECFDVFERVPDEVRPDAGYPAASDGFWFLLKPPKKGSYHIRFGGRYNSPDRGFGQMVQDIEYQILVD